MANFPDVVDATDDLSVDEQETLVQMLRRRIAERNRASLVHDVAEARAESEAGTSVNDIMQEVRGES